MGINDISGYNINDSGKTQTSGISQGSVSDTSSQTQNVSGRYGAAENAAPGDIISGKITTSKNGDISLQLEDNTLLNAHIDQNVHLTLGETVSFQVKSSDNGLVLSPLGTNTSAGASAQQALASAELESTESAIQMVTQMMDEGMSIDTSSLTSMSRLVSEFPSVDMTEVIQLKNMNVDVSENNIEQLKNYKNAEYQIEQSTSEIAGLVTEDVSGLIDQGYSDRAVSMYKELLGIVSGDGNTVMSSPASKYMDSSQLSQTADILSNAGISEEITDSIRNGTISVKDLLDAVMQAVSDNNSAAPGQTGVLQNTGNGQSDDKTIQPGMVQSGDDENQPGTQTDENMAPAGKTSDTGAAQMNIQNAGQTEIMNAAVKMIRQMTDNGIAAPAGTAQNSSDGAQTNDTDIKENPTGKSLTVAENANEKLQGTASENALAMIKQLGSDRTSPLLKLLQSDPIKNLIRNSLSGQYGITPRETADKENVRQLYEKIIKQTDEIQNVMSKNQMSDSAAGNATQNLKNNLEFINQINQTFSYVQLPVRLTDGNAHGDLYVYTNKKNLSSGSGNVTALLHLDMEHLGPMDVYISMNKAEHVNTHFYLQDDESLDLISSHIDELDRHLSERGYDVTTECSKKSEMTSASSEIVRQERSVSKTVSYSSFDARA